MNYRINNMKVNNMTDIEKEIIKIKIDVKCINIQLWLIGIALIIWVIVTTYVDIRLIFDLYPR